MAAIEGHHAIKTGKLLSLSEQQIMDCDTQENGCNGGLMDWVFKYVETNGLEIETAYPYVARPGVCKADKAKEKVMVAGFADVEPESLSQLKAAVAKGPVSVAIEADRRVFQMYKSGILNSSECGQDIDSGLTAVGYGSENGQDFFIVRNQWSAMWGDKGYIKIAAVEGKGICGIQVSPSYPTM